mmetsp:Transcript_7810/g.10213  ORF Transcript_7810/g.10213 Transcript_7810/m.10213 type:complete len:395 (+) Transcript_7810:353-1537(+)
MHFRHAKEKRDVHSLKYRGWQVFISVAIFWIVVSLIPVYNKVVFSGVAGDAGFPYPLTTTCFQLGFCAFALTLGSVIKHSCGTGESSWIFGSGFKFKLKHTIKIGFLFGLKFGVTNWGLHVLKLSPHLLLQSTDLMWTVIFAHLINKEALDHLEAVCCLGSIAGTMLIAYRTHQQIPDLFPLLLNLISPVLLGLCVSELRRTARMLLILHNHAEGRVPFMNAFELTAFKLWFSTATVLPFAYFFEEMTTVESSGLNLSGQTPVSIVLRSQNAALTIAAVGGGILVLIFQVNVTWLCSLTSAISVAIVGGVKVIPQWIIAILFSQSIDLHISNVFGALLLLGSSVMWTKLKYGNIGSNVKQMQYVSEKLRKTSFLGDSERCSLVDSPPSEYGSIT